ncbi:MAG: polysaccharide deacetylase family protein, partial [Vicinamibacteria bacterium]
DNQWPYMKTHGDAGWESFPSYLELVVPRALQILDRRKLAITFFVVGQDAALPKNREAFDLLGRSGHEIGNHSFRHEPWLHLYTREEIEKEIVGAEEAIASATGHRPVGFRGPGYSLSRNTLEVLSERGYLYDASTLPTFLGPAARAYYFFKSRLDDGEREQRKALFGSFKDGLKPLKPYRWSIDGEKLVELPVTTLPLFRVPFHFSYVLYLSGYSRTLAKSYFTTALRLVRLGGIEPSLLLHPLDVLGREDVPALEFFPGMGLGREEKLSLVEECLDELQSSFTVTSLREHAQRARATPAVSMP